MKEHAKNARFGTIGFFYHGFEFQDYVYNGFHNFTMLCLHTSNITIISVKNVGYVGVIHSTSKS